MSLCLSFQLKDALDTICIYAELGGRFRKAFAETVTSFFGLAINDDSVNFESGSVGGRRTV